MELHLADCREVMRGMAPRSVDAVVSDPPYELGFMGASWDSTGIAFDREVWTEALRVLKPGGHVLAFGATRTWHWLACALELSGFESRGSIAWIQGQGMQHGLDVSKALDADAGAEREVVGTKVGQPGYSLAPSKGANVYGGGRGGSGDPERECSITAPATEEAQQWAGYGTQLAPKHEPIAMFRKPLDGTYVENVRAHGVGGLNIDGCRLEGGKRDPGYADPAAGGTNRGVADRCRSAPRAGSGLDPTVGRWPPNVALDEAAAAQLDAMVGKRTSGARTGKAYGNPNRVVECLSSNNRIHDVAPASTQGPSAYFYCPKAATGERDRGCEHLRWVRAGKGWRIAEPGEAPELVGNPWPTVKPLELMRWLVRLVTPPGGHVLDPFLGSGTTGVGVVCEGDGRRFTGCDTDPVAHTIANARIRWAQGLGPSADELPKGVRSQGSLFA